MPKTIIDEQDDEGEDNAEEESNNNDLIAMTSPSRRASRPATHQPTVGIFFNVSTHLLFYRLNENQFFRLVFSFSSTCVKWFHMIFFYKFWIKYQFEAT